jgi:hypothetical protein
MKQPELDNLRKHPLITELKTYILDYRKTLNNLDEIPVGDVELFRKRQVQIQAIDDFIADIT